MGRMASWDIPERPGYMSIRRTVRRCAERPDTGGVVMREARFHSRIIAMHLGLVGLVLAGCAAKAPLKAAPDEIVTIRRGSDVRLINEGGPVFAMPGEVLLLASAINTEGLKITAERADGSKIQSISAAQLSPEGTFELRGPLSAGLFFATTVVEDQDAVYRMRALVRPEEGKKITIDTTSSLIAADIIQASKRHQKAEISGAFTRTEQLTAAIRASLPAEELREVDLSGTNDALVGQLHALASARPELYAALRGWEEMLHGSRPTESPLISGQAAEPQAPVGEPPK